MTIQEAMAVAVQQHQSGRLAEAEGIYRQVLAADPRHPEALHYLGLIASQAGQHETGAGLIKQAIAFRPDDASAHNNLGNILRDLGRTDEAVAAFRQAIALQPEYAAAHSNLGNALSDLGRLEEAVDEYRRAIALDAVYAEAHYNLGNALGRTGDLAGAIAAFRRAIELRPTYFAAFNNLGLALARDRRLEEAVNAYRGAIRTAPNRAEAYNNLGNALGELGHMHEAVATYEQALRIRPDFWEALGSLGNLLTAQGRIDEAIATYQRVRRLKPDSASCHSNLILTMHYLPDLPPGEVLREMRQWNQEHAAPLIRLPLGHGNDPSPDRKLRVGYVSADLREHAVGLTLLPCFEAHDRGQFEIVCYSDTEPRDAIAERFRRGAALLRETGTMSDEELAGRIRADHIDVLVDLSLHTGFNRLPVFARKPAPVQISWLGYPGSAGLEAIDYRITDPFLEPPGCAPAGYPDAPLRMPHCWCCYGAREDSPAPGELPAGRNGRVTFGSFNNLAKLNPRVLALWARILGEVENSRLLLLSKFGPSATILDFLQQRGIGPGRVEFLGYYPPSSVRKGTHRPNTYLHRYHELDIALDSFPYNGMTTTCDALWMGVPVVARIGETPISRASFSLLSNVGLPELAATSDEDYVRIAMAHARDLPRLADLRATLRERMKASPLLDYRGFARALEENFRKAWRAWCATQTPQPPP